jgi:hypothetical protein
MWGVYSLAPCFDDFVHKVVQGCVTSAFPKLNLYSDSFPFKNEREAYEITSLSVFLSVHIPLITFEPVGRFSLNSAGTACHLR